MVFLLFDLEKFVVVAALLAVVLGYHVHAFDRAGRYQRDALDVFVEPLFEMAHPRFDVSSLRFGGFKKMIFLFQRRANFQEIIKRHHAAAQQIKYPRFETLGPVIF